ncbi:MAG: hypothetical protein IH591_17910 [Bacteroidales bacterium]|nr:hypothetical protein [Bacteroidales bacterium]
MRGSVPDKMILHRMGYHTNQEGIGRRYVREDDNWSDHLGNTKRFILNVIKKKEPDQVTILGSGWLLDIPLREILRTGVRVRLVDIVHPPGIVKSLDGEPMAELVTDDITGGLPAAVWEMAASKPRPDVSQVIEAIAALYYEPQYEPGLVLSVNLLSQLATQPFTYLVKKKLLRRDDYKMFAAAVQENHLAFLKKHEAILVTDFAEVYTDRYGAVTREQILGCRLPAGKNRKEWTWHFDTDGSYMQGYKTSMEVVALYL